MSAIDTNNKRAKLKTYDFVRKPTPKQLASKMWQLEQSLKLSGTVVRKGK